MRRLFITTLAAGLVFGALPLSAQAPSYPNRPIRIVVPFPAGGPNDFFARTLANKLSPAIGQPVVIENRSGAAGMAGTDYVAKQAPDGYTLVIVSASALAIAPTISDNPPFDPAKDLATVTLVARVPEALVAIPKLGVKTLPDLVAKAKASPGVINFASAGNGGMPHLAGELLKREAGINIIHVPYRGAAPAVSDLLGGHVELMFADLPVLLPHITAGKLIPLALASGARAGTLPDVPTTAEAGLANVLADNWYGMLAPAATPRPILQKLNEQVVAALASADLKETFAKQGAVAAGGSAEGFAAFLRAETEKWGKLAKAVGAKLD